MIRSNAHETPSGSAIQLNRPNIKRSAAKVLSLKVRFLDCALQMRCFGANGNAPTLTKIKIRARNTIQFAR